MRIAVLGGGNGSFAAAGDLKAVIQRVKRSRTLRASESQVGGESPLVLVEERGRLAAGEQLILARAESVPNTGRDAEAPVARLVVARNARG